MLACGGDGTVTACADGIVGTGVPMAIVPMGTGNLLARNLGVPMGPDEALAVALGGVRQPIDAGIRAVSGPPTAPPGSAASSLTGIFAVEPGQVPSWNGCLVRQAADLLEHGQPGGPRDPWGHPAVTRAGD